MMPEFPKITGYTLVERIGGGGFSSVFKAVDFDKHRVAACKHIVLTEKTTDKERKTLDKEMRIHSALKHRNVLEFLNAVVVDLKHQHRYYPGYYMLMELASAGDLFDKIAQDIGVDDRLAHFFFDQLLDGMTYIHSQGVCHRDLKPENLLLDIDGTLKISDYGLSAVYKLKDSGKTRPLTERCGSMPYVAPELAYETGYAAEPIDVWGCGIILFTMLAGNTPWDEPTVNSPEFVAYSDGSIFDQDPWNRLSDDAVSLICGMLAIDPNDRLTLAEVRSEPWCNRPSQAPRTQAELAALFMETLRKTGDLEVAAPDFGGTMEVDDGGSQFSNSYSVTQFTQNLMLFSQTQNGTRFTPVLTRFYASTSPSHLCELVLAYFDALPPERGRAKLQPPPRLNGEYDTATDATTTPFVRVGIYDKRGMPVKGWIKIEQFDRAGVEGSFLTMARDLGDPLAWRRLWSDLWHSSGILPHVMLSPKKKAEAMALSQGRQSSLLA